jgi:hypothetical protein
VKGCVFRRSKQRLAAFSEKGLVRIISLSLILFSPTCRSSNKNLKVLSVTPSASPSLQDHRIEDLQLLCNHVSEIKIIPFEGESVDDPAYNAFIRAGEKAIPCLIDKISDTSPMPDPRQAPKVDTVVGDIAFFVLIDVTKVDLTELLPREVRRKFEDEGIYAYFEYTEKNKNRQKLQKSLYEWYRQKYGTDAHRS